MGFGLADIMEDTEPNPRITRHSEEVIMTIMTDIQKAVDQLHNMSGEDFREFPFPVHCTN
jgi:hypothetical protein